MGLISGLLIGGAIALAKPVHDMLKADKLDAQAQELRLDAADEIGKARADQQELKKALDASCKKLADRKKSVIDSIIPKFLEVYAKICMIDFDIDDRDMAKELSTANLQIISKEYISISELPIHEMSDSQLLSNAVWEGVKGYLFGASPILSAFTGSIKKDSEIALADAKEYKSSAGSYAYAVEKSKNGYNAVIWQLNSLSDIIAKLNALMLRCCRYNSKVIDEKGYESKNYTDKDLEYIIACINIATVLKECITTPIFNDKNELTKAAVDLIATTENYTKQFAEELSKL